MKYRIAISGHARSGKNTVAELLVNNFDIQTNESKIIALADPMKRILKSMFPLAEDECLYGASELRSNVIPGGYLDKDGNPLTYRSALISFGAYGRSFKDTIWLDCLAKDAKESKEKLYIVSDVRFIIEYNFLSASNFYMIRVLRDGLQKGNDKSETEQDSIQNTAFDSVIYNNGSMEELNERVKEVVADIKKVCADNFVF